MVKRILMIAAMVLTVEGGMSGGGVAQANGWDENVACPVKWTFWYPQYLGGLNILKSKGHLTDREQAHGLLNELLAQRNSRFAELFSMWKVGAVILEIARHADERCLKAGIDWAFPEPQCPAPPPGIDRKIDRPTAGQEGGRN